MNKKIAYMSVPFTNLKEVTTSEGDEVEYTPPANTLSKHNCSWEALTCCVVVVILLIMFVPIAIIIAVDDHKYCDECYYGRPFCVCSCNISRVQYNTSYYPPTTYTVNTTGKFIYPLFGYWNGSDSCSSNKTLAKCNLEGCKANLKQYGGAVCPNNNNSLTGETACLTVSAAGAVSCNLVLTLLASILGLVLLL